MVDYPVFAELGKSQALAVVTPQDSATQPRRSLSSRILGSVAAVGLSMFLSPAVVSAEGPDGMEACSEDIGWDSHSPQEHRYFLDDFTSASRSNENWCGFPHGGSTMEFGPDGLKMGIPKSAALWSWSLTSVELFGRSKVLYGDVVQMRVKGPDVASFEGSTAWGIYNVSLDPYYTALFWHQTSPLISSVMWANSDWRNVDQFTATSQGSTDEHGVPTEEYDYRTEPLSPTLLAGEHLYTIRLERDYVEFFVDGDSVARMSPPPPAGDRLNPLRPELWMQNLFWTPLPIPTTNDTPHSLEAKCFSVQASDSASGHCGKLPYEVSTKSL